MKGFLKPKQWCRFITINFILMRYGLTLSLLGRYSLLLRVLCYLNPWSYRQPALTRGEAIRLAFERLGPVFIKFGQMLSTRPDLIPLDIILELEKLQDRVPPFPGTLAQAMIEQSLQRPIHELFAHFSEQPLASASIAQVHAARLTDGNEVVIKILRPRIQEIIRQDVNILYNIAWLLEVLWSQGKRLHPFALVAEFEQTIFDELDLMREAASASQLRRNFCNSSMIYVPKIYWNFVRANMLVMERIYGVRISDIATLKQRQVNLKKLAEYGVEIFFTQVFRDNFFHADMHPGNLFVDTTDPENPRYIGVDFGIMGSLSEFDQHYLAENLLAFFDRDYRRVALLHVESGWVAPNTRVEQMEAAIRTVCEPIFERPLEEISFGRLLLQLFMTAERFNMELQPQLLLLQKTLLSIEGLGRQLYPQLNLWDTAKPFMQRWIKQRYGIKNLAHLAMEDWSAVSDKLVRSPKLILNLLQQVQQEYRYKPQRWHQQAIKARRQRQSGALFGFGLASWSLVLLSYLLPSIVLALPYQLGLLAVGGVCLLSAWISQSDYR